jgi:hypothetical protein
VLGVWATISTVWGLAGPPALGLLMELAGARGALLTGGLLIAGTIGAGFALRRRRATTPVVLDLEEHGPQRLGVEQHGAATRPGLSTAA